MKSSELYKLSIWYNKNIIDTQFLSIIDNADKVVNSLLINSYNTESKLDAIYTSFEHALTNINHDDLTIDDLNALKKLGLENIILKPAILSLKALFINNNTDLHNISARLQSMQNMVKYSDINFSNLTSFLPRLFEITEDTKIDENKVLTRLTFHNDASINNVVNLSDWSSSWYKIARGYAMTLGETPEEFEVISASKGSIIFDLLLNLETVNMIGETFNHIADFAFTMIEIKAALKGLSYFKKNDPDTYEALKKKLEEDLDNKHESMAEDIAQRIFDKYSVDKENQEIKVNLKHGVKELSKFVDKGGDISFKSNNIEHDEQVLLVNDALLMLQNRSNEQKLIENKTDNE